jgi:tRNA G10  N-methylase Trm11
MSTSPAFNQLTNPKKITNTWLFILGRESLLSLAEIKAAFLLNNINFKITYQKDNKLVVASTNFPDPQNLMKRLGGTIKICELIGRLENSKTDLADYLNKKIPTGKIEFSINGFNALGIEIKKKLKQTGRSARYIEAKNTATIIYNKLIKGGADIEICDNQAFITKAIQSIDDFSKRDFGRPGRDEESGMLPPKLAMMMINLATQKENAVILDPFCGSGTIVTEAILMGYNNIIGSDLSKAAIDDTNKNIEWIKNIFKIKNHHLNINVFESDIFDITKKINNSAIDAVIAEPYLGKPLRGNESRIMIEKQAAELKNLYLIAFSKFAKILKPGGIVVFIIPRFNCSNQWIKIDCENEILKLGFKNEPILSEHKQLFYWRPGQHVGREIWRFKKS